MSFQCLSWLTTCDIFGYNLSIVTSIHLYQISKENGKSLFFNIYSISFTNKEILYSLDSSGGWELSGIRGMSLKETGYGENPIS